MAKSATKHQPVEAGRRATRTPVSTLRGKLRNVVGTLEVLESELDQIVELSGPHCNQDENERGCPNEYDHLFRHAAKIMCRLAEHRGEMRRFLSKPRSGLRRRQEAACCSLFSCSCT